MLFPYPVAVCDVGGTNCRVSIQEAPGGPLKALPHLLTRDYPGLGQAIRAATVGDAERPRSVIACGAGPVHGRRLKLTNAPWMMDGPEILAMLGLDQGLLLNDFEAQALSLPAMRSSWVRTIGPDLATDDGPEVILGPGTGLGIGCLIQEGGRYVPLSSEACHIGFAPETEDEARWWPFLGRAHGRITTESVLSGAGLERVHRARLEARGHAPAEVHAADVTRRALSDPQGDEAATVAAYWRLVGRFAGDMGITFMATGGITLGGGILPRIVDLVDAAAFREAFEMKAPVADLARRIPTRLIVEEDTVLDGMAAIASAPDRYGIDYATRAWKG